MSEAAWRQIEPLLPANGGRGGQWSDHRTVINAILWKLRTGAPWRDLPERIDQVERRCRKGRFGGRPPHFDREAYRQRNVVERCFNRFKQ